MLLLLWESVLEAKCPLCLKENFPDEEFKGFCITKKEDKWILKQEHAYYYQVQTQMHVCKCKYCDFVVWSESEGVMVDRVLVDDMFYDHIHDLEHFFKYGILPEIIGKWLMRQPISDKENVVQSPMPSIAETTMKKFVAIATNHQVMEK